MKLIKKSLSNISPAWIIFGVALFFLWNTPVVYPIKLFVVFLHEASHGLAAIFTGGSLEKIVINSAVGGYAITVGGIRFFILSAGYLGSLILGGVILLLASRPRGGKRLSLAIGLTVLAITFFFVRNIFGIVFCLLFALGLLYSSQKFSQKINSLLLRAIGFTSCLYAVFDIKSDIFRIESCTSDATMLAELTWIPAYVWGAIWIFVSLILTILFLGASSKT